MTPPHQKRQASEASTEPRSLHEPGRIPRDDPRLGPLDPPPCELFFGLSRHCGACGFDERPPDQRCPHWLAVSCDGDVVLMEATEDLINGGLRQLVVFVWKFGGAR